MTTNIIYVLKNKINDKVYVGQTWQNIHDRWDSGHGYKHCLHLQNAINKYGKQEFYYEVLTFCATQEAADACEQYFIDKYDSITNGYNIRDAGSRGKHSESTKAKMRLKKGWKQSDEAKLKMSIAKLGKPGNRKRGSGKGHKPYVKVTMRKSHKGKTWKLIDNKRVWIDGGVL